MIVNPLFVFTFAWTGVSFLYVLGMTTNLVVPSFLGIVVVILNILSMLVIYILVCSHRTFSPVIASDSYFPRILKFLKFMFIIWFFGTAFEIYYCKGVPLQWIFSGNGRLYTDFGVPSLHGILNAIYLQIVTITSFVFFRFKKYSFLVFLLLLFAWPLLILGRGILLSALLQSACMYFYFNRITFKSSILLIFSSVSAVIAFGVLGNMRQTANPFFYLIKTEYVDFFGALPSGFLWFYVYLTAGMSNFFNNIDLLSTNFQFGYSLSNMLPSVVRSFFDLNTRNDAFTFVDANLNTSTIYAGFVSDFGAIGGVFLVAIVQLFCCLAYSLFRNRKPWGIFAYSACFQVLTFSIFYDMFFLLPTLFQFVICFFLYIYLNSRFNFSVPFTKQRCS